MRKIVIGPNIEKTLNPNETFLFKDLISPHFNPNWHPSSISNQDLFLHEH